MDVDDVLALLWYVLFPDDYPIDAEADFDKNGSVDVDDVLTLLWYVRFPEDNPLKNIIWPAPNGAGHYCIVINEAINSQHPGDTVAPWDK